MLRGCGLYLTPPLPKLLIRSHSSAVRRVRISPGLHAPLRFPNNRPLEARKWGQRPPVSGACVHMQGTAQALAGRWKGTRTVTSAQRSGTRISSQGRRTAAHLSTKSPSRGLLTFEQWDRVLKSSGQRLVGLPSPSRPAMLLIR